MFCRRHAHPVKKPRPAPLSFLPLEDRVTPATIDVTGVGAGAFSTDGNVFMRHVDIDVSTGTGLIDPFLRTHHKDSEQGYNTDYRNAGGGAEREPARRQNRPQLHESHHAR